MIRLKRHVKKHGPLSHTKHEAIDASLVEWSYYVRAHMVDFPWSMMKQLIKSGFFSSKEEKWLDCFASYKEAKKAIETSKQQKWPIPSIKWASYQRTHREHLEDFKLNLLRSIDFDWAVKPKAKAIAWEAGYAKLIEYKKRFGDCKVPAKWAEDLQFGRWIYGLRYKKAKGNLSDEQIEQLDELGFLWDPLDHIWNLRYEELVRYYREHGHSRVPLRSKEHRELALWVSNIRRRPLAQSPDRIRRLKAVEFSWNPVEETWEQNYSRLEKYVQRYGNALVPIRWSEDYELGQWVGLLRDERTRKKLSKENIERLNALGFVWDAVSEKWERRLKELEDFVRGHGHCRVPSKSPKYGTLGKWLSYQLSQWDEIPRMYQKRLEALGAQKRTLEFFYEMHRRNWEQRLQEFEDFVEENGHCRVLASDPKTFSLHGWLRYQLSRWGELPIGDRKRLEALGVTKVYREFMGKAQRLRWEQRLEQLEDFVKRFGHCRVARIKHSEYGSLSGWLSIQRGRWKEIPDEYRKRLEALGVTKRDRESAYNARRLKWEQRFQELEDFIQRFGHCRVPRGSSEYSLLYSWLSDRRRLWSDLPEDDKKRLEALGVAKMKRNFAKGKTV